MGPQSFKTFHNDVKTRANCLLAMDCSQKMPCPSWDLHITSWGKLTKVPEAKGGLPPTRSLTLTLWFYRNHVHICHSVVTTKGSRTQHVSVLPGLPASHPLCLAWLFTQKQISFCDLVDKP